MASSKLYLSSVSSGDGGYFYNANDNTSGLFAYGDYTFYVGTSNIGGSIGNARMIIKQGGNVGIGTTSPASLLHVNGNSFLLGANYGIYGNNDITNYYIKGNASGSQLVLNWFSGFQFKTSGGTDRLIIDSTGNVGINTTSPITKLDVNGAGSTGTISWANDAGRKRGYLYSDSAGVAIYSTALSTAGIYLADSAQIDFRLGGSIKMLLNSSGSLTVSGDLVAYGSPSDKRLKENIKPIKNPLGKIKKLKGVTFDWKKSENILDIKEDYGFIAQDVQKVIPELIRKNENELLSMRHQGVIPILVEAIKELEARVKELENK